MRYYLVKDASNVHPVSYDGVAAYTPPAGWTLLSEAGFASWRVSNPAPTAVVPVPVSVGPFQIRAGLIAAGVAATSAALDTVIYGAIDTAIVDAGQNALARLAWDKASEFRRDAPFLEVVRVVLGKTHAEVDDIFRNGNTF